MKVWARCVAAVSLTLSIISPVSAYPDGPVRLLVGWPAGGPVDAVGRLVQGELGKRLGVSVVIENKPGASGMLATDLLLSQRRDGQTLLLCTHYESMNPVMFRSAKYKVDDIAGISLLARYYLTMVTAEGSQFRSIADVVDYAKKNPGKLTYGTSGPGSTQEMLMRQLGDLTGTTMQTVPFRGAPPALIEVVAGRLDTFLSPTGPAIPLATSGQIRLLASTSTSRLKVAPNVPTFSEIGYPLKLYGWIGICAASGTPPPIIDRLNSEISAIAKSEEFRSKIEATGQIAESTSASELQAILASMSEEIAQLSAKYGIRVE